LKAPVWLAPNGYSPFKQTNVSVKTCP